MHKIDFYVKLTGSFLFDLNMRATAITLVEKYPGLMYRCDMENKRPIIEEELNDYWYDLWCEEVFRQVGEA